MGHLFAGNGIALAASAGKLEEAADVVILVEGRKQARGFTGRKLKGRKGHRFGGLIRENVVAGYDLLEAEHAGEFSAHVVKWEAGAPGAAHADQALFCGRLATARGFGKMLGHLQRTEEGL